MLNFYGSRPRLTGTFLVLAIATLVILSDPINRVALRLSWSSLPFSGVPWEAGNSGIIHAPSSATPDELIQGYFPRHYPDRVLEFRRVPVLSVESHPEICTAALVDHNHERWIYLFYYRGETWRMKMFRA